MPKKSRSDVIRAAVGYYLKNKGYVGDRFRRSDIVLVQNRREFVVDTMQANDLDRSNNFTYSNHTIINGQIVAEHFGRFTQFVEVQSDNLRQELRRLYAPMICHLYIDLLKAREHKQAREFLKKFAYLVAPIETFEAAPPTMKINGCPTPNDESNSSVPISFNENMETDPELRYFMNMIQNLSAFSLIEEVETDAELAQFRSSKYEFYSSANVIQLLTSYLENRGHVVIISLFHTWFQMHVVDNELVKCTDEAIYLGSTTIDEEMSIQEESHTIQQKSSSKIKSEQNYKSSNIKRHSGSSSSSSSAHHPPPPPPAEVKTEKSEIGLDNEDKKKLNGCNSTTTYLETIRQVKEQFSKTQILFPRCIKVAEKDRGMISAHLDPSECHMAVGFNNSAIQLWQVNQHTCSGKNLYRQRKDTDCRWEINNCGAEDDDPIIVDIQKHSNDKFEKERRKFMEDKYVDNSFNEFAGINLRGHSSGVTDVRFSTHYPLLYSVSKDSTMRSWHAETYSCASIYCGHRYPIWCFDESPLGTYIATGSKDLTARLWSIEREYPYITFIGHTQDVECIAFHPNGNYIATGSTDLSVRLWGATTGKLMRVFTDCKQAVTCISFSPDGKLLAAAGEEAKVRIFDLAAGAQFSEVKEHSASITSIAWSSNGRQLATACRDGTLRVWDTKRLTGMHDSSSSTTSSNTTSSSSSSSSSSPSRLISLNTNCQRLVKVFFARNETVCCIGC